MPRTAAIFDGHWFAPFLVRIHEALRDIRANYVVWQDEGGFEVMADLADELLQFVGVTYEEGPVGRFRIIVSDADAAFY